MKYEAPAVAAIEEIEGALQCWKNKSGFWVCDEPAR